ncbi:MAG: hypothetical protein DMG48_22040 [Acidobacteria bacterium]|nr:MAG: hypothetical protein DMG48_22040 [Acidobacteriota bacterium]
MAEIDKINPVIQACLSNAEHLLNAAKDVRKPGQNHIGYHLAALALEEIGKITMIVVSAVNPTSSKGGGEDDDPDSIKLTEDHERKLFWALWAPSLEAGQITADQFREVQSLSKRIHELRLASLYVDPASPIPQYEVSDQDLEALISLTDARLNIQKLTKFRELDGPARQVLEWFYRAVDDPQLKMLVFARSSLDKLTEFGGDSNRWMTWLRDQVDEMNATSQKLLQEELLRVDPGDAQGNEPKWQMKIRLMSWSHSIRPKPLAAWNRGVHHIKLFPTKTDRKELLVQFVLPKKILIQGLWAAGMQMSWTFTIALNIGSLGYFWWYTPTFVSKYYEELFDLESNTAVVAERNPQLVVSWGNQALNDRDLSNVGSMFAHLLSVMMSHRGAYDRYFQGLALIAKNDLFGQCELPIVRQFYGAFKEGMAAYGDWDGQPTTFATAIEKAFEEFQHGSEFSAAMKLTLQLATDKTTDPRSVTLEDAIKMKAYCDGYFLTRAKKDLQQKIKQSPPNASTQTGDESNSS